MSDNLLVSLQKYASRPKFNPLENFTTEAFAWLLRNNTDALNAFLTLIASKISEKASRQQNDGQNLKLLNLDIELNEVRCETQVQLSSGIADLVLYLPNSTIVVEIKVWASGSKDQVTSYATSLREQGHQNVISVFLAPGLPHQNEDADVTIRWADVYKALSEGKPDERRLEFLGYLDSQGLSPGLDLDCAAMIYAPEVYRFIDVMLRQWQAILGNLEPSKDFPISEKTNAWGRTGIMRKRTNLDANYWNPAITIGVLHDPRDHCFEPITKSQGAIFMLCVDVGSYFFDRLLQKDTDWANFKESVKQACANGNLHGWNCFDGLEYYKDNLKNCNQWHPFVIYKPVSELLVNRPNKEMSYCSDEIKDIFEKETKFLFETITTMPTFRQVLNYFKLPENLNTEK